MRITDLDQGDHRAKIIEGVAKAIEATGYHSMADQFRNEPDMRERIALFIGHRYAKRLGPEKGAEFTDIAMSVVETDKIWHTWQEIILEWPDRITRYRWRGITGCGWPREVESWSNDLGWFRCPSVGVHLRIAEQMQLAGEVTGEVKTVYLNKEGKKMVGISGSPGKSLT